MKVLTSTDGTILTFPTFTDGKIDGPEDAGFFGLDGKGYTEAVVADIHDTLITMKVKVAVHLPIYKYSEAKDFMRDLRWIGKRLADVTDGTTITPAHTGRGYGLNVPKDATPNYTEGMTIGSVVAVGPGISPPALMNARGTVKAINGTKATIQFDAGDISRVNRKTGKNFGVTTNVPLSALEVVVA